MTPGFFFPRLLRFCDALKRIIYDRNARITQGNAKGNSMNWRIKHSVCAVVFAAGLCASGESWAQRTNDNALAAASDAFGTTVGNESIGLYSPGDVRGFNPINAGNVRVEGLYFDRQSDITGLLIAGSAVRVGISAQSYAFPGPTGIVDYSLRTPGDKTAASVVVTAGPYDSFSGEIGVQTPITDKLSIGGALSGNQSRKFYAALSRTHAQAVIARWEPVPGLEIVPYWGREHVDFLGATIYPVMGGSFVPPEVDRSVFSGQRWGVFETNRTNYGVVAKAFLPDDYKLQIGAFRSIDDRRKIYYNLYLNTDAQGFADNYVVGYPPTFSKSVSGEVRLDKNFIIGSVNNVVDLTFRARDVNRKFGGTDTQYLGHFQIGVSNPVPKPAYTFGPTSTSHATQGTAGINYQAEWKGVGQASVGIQKTFYSRTRIDPVLGESKTKTQPWIFNTSVAVPITTAIAVYGSFTQGLEEADEAPSNASNRGEAVPAIQTSQVDAGIRYKITPAVSLVAGVFQVKKPYYSLDATSRYAELGDVRHRGIEVSLSGQVTPDLTLIAGAVLLQARINPTAGLVLAGNEPLGRLPRIFRVNAEYRVPALPGFSVDGQVEAVSSRIGSVDGIARIPERYSGNLGLRYRFQAWTTPVSFRFQALNITDTYGWTVGPTGLWDNSFERRRFIGTISADF